MTPAADHQQARRARGPAAVLTAAVLWGTVGPAQVLASSHADPSALGVARLLVGGAALSAVHLRRASWRALAGRGVIDWVLAAAGATGVYQVTFMHAVDRLGAAVGTAIALGVAPVATGLCAHRWAGERLTRPWVVGTATAVAGCVLVLDPWNHGNPSTLGVAFAVVSGTCYGAYTVAAKRYLTAGAPALPATSATLLVAGLALSPVLLARPQHLVEPTTLELVGWTGLVGTALAYRFFADGLRHTTAATVGTLSLAEPLAAAALGIFVLGERPSAPASAGCLILIAGLATVVGGRQGERRRAGRSAAGRPVGRVRVPVDAAARSDTS